MSATKYSAMSCRRDHSPPPPRPPIRTWNWSLGGLLDKLTLETGALDGDEATVGQKRRRDEEATAELLRAAEAILSISATLPAEMEELLVARLAGTDELSVLVDAALQASVAAAPG